MKKILIIAGFIGLAGTSLWAQPKFGYVNASELIYLMPEMKKVEASLDSTEKALGAQYQKHMDEYNLLLQKLETQQKDGVSSTMIQLTQEEILAKQDFLGKAQQIYQEELVNMQNKLLTPLNEKILKAIKEVSTEKGLNYVFDISKGAVLYWDEKDDVSKDVRKKLGIPENATLPNNGGK